VTELLWTAISWQIENDFSDKTIRTHSTRKMTKPKSKPSSVTTLNLMISLKMAAFGENSLNQSKFAKQKLL
jgi:hypothetical protein